jgi:hypothetical protein
VTRALNNANSAAALFDVFLPLAGPPALSNMFRNLCGRYTACRNLSGQGAEKL